MKGKISNYISTYWLFFIIISQPILDIIAYFSFNEYLTPISFVTRSVYLLFIVLYTFIKVKDKKKYFLLELPFVIFSILHLLNSIRTSGFNIFDDLRYLIQVMQMPIVTIALCSYVSENRYHNKKIEKGLWVSLVIICLSVVLSVITKSYVTTYEDYGLTGWFTSANTQSMILVCIFPYCLYTFSKRNKYVYLFGLMMAFFLLFFNGTRACYYTLILSLIVMIYILFTHFEARKNLVKVSLTFMVLILSLLMFKFSSTFERKSNMDDVNNENQEQIDLLGDDSLTKKEIIKLLKTSFLYEDMINTFGEDVVYEEMKDKITASNLSDNRLVKRIYAKIIFDNSDTLTKLVGFNHGEIQKYGMDIENDITAIFYYYGYLGFTLYIVFLGSFFVLAFKLLIKNPIMIFSGKFVILSFSILLSIFGSEYSGALLRKSNANIYLALLLTLYFIYINKNLKEKRIIKNKITFLVLHLGYGGIETSVINQVNTLANDYEIEIVSFYRLKNNQTDRIDSRVKIKYLYDCGPNRDEFMKAVSERSFLNILSEGFKAIDILIKKKVLVISNIIDCESKYIISTRYEFNMLLSKYGNKNSVKIAEEHCYHNNNEKYIKILSNKYGNIDYLFALTKTLEEDYKKFLKNNKHTKVVLVPNMLYDIPDKTSSLKEKNIITVSRFDYGKRVDDIIKAFSMIDDKMWKLYIIGDGKEMDNLSHLIKELKLEDRVFLEGYKNKEEIEEYMLKSSLFLMASVTEGLPMVLLEAMSYGIPCIAYETASGVNDIISNDVNGYVIKDRNEEEYVKRINEVISDSELRERLGVNAKETSKKFSKEEVKKILCKVLK